ncbi:LacI family DNA-binding transcriptional regulator [Microbacterium sp. CFBP9034]|uniref:LacI family DNA-binding transcriptional regulator n=1 Tax=Microbacterium sp. CFBP9034 TaxID=3096540 RepID=UPI002A6AC7C9|nr:LacI family DNA-binding transcriptional regulator [Microbacterium sp. CFBP9034]MDY0908827.1 LacI family DNA-binding transcriptional regulator [Microbacterium sp. CFBP9034]
MERPQIPHANPHVTMHDVAEKAGVSAQTVSNVINGRTERVGAETIDRVTRIIDELGYRLNQSARSLRKGRTGIVGLGVPVLASEYYGELAERLSHLLSDRGIRLVTENTGGAMSAEVESLAASHLETYDGFILAIAASESADLNRILPTKPIILLGERATSTRFDHVLMDNVGGGALATSHLIERGARAIVALGGSASGSESVQTLRTRGYLEAHRDHGVEVRPELIVDCGLDMADGHRAVTALLDAGVHIDGIFALTDSAAFGALRAIGDRGLRVPADVQVVGFDNVRASAFTMPRLTTIEPGNDAMAERIVAIMMARLGSGGPGVAPDHVMIPTRLVARDSTR